MFKQGCGLLHTLTNILLASAVLTLWVYVACSGMKVTKEEVASKIHEMRSNFKLSGFTRNFNPLSFKEITTPPPPPPPKEPEEPERDWFDPPPPPKEPLPPIKLKIIELVKVKEKRRIKREPPPPIDPNIDPDDVDRREERDGIWVGNILDNLSHKSTKIFRDVPELTEEEFKRDIEPELREVIDFFRTPVKLTPGVRGDEDEEIIEEEDDCLRIVEREIEIDVNVKR